MSQDTKNKFIETLLASRIAAKAEIQNWLPSNRDRLSAGELANRLDPTRSLDVLQADYLLKGRKRLRFGNYVLTDRRTQDPLGDSFVGRHLKLDRAVNLLFLSKEYSNKLVENEALVRELALTTDFSHPNLEQVHLIDRDSGRYLFVTQNVLAKNLGDPVLLTQLQGGQIPRIIKQTIAGLAAAHNAGLFHGQLTESEVCVDEQGAVTLTGFLQSNLHCRLLEQRTPAAADDVHALQQIAKRLVRRFSSPPAQRWLTEIQQVDNNSASLSRLAQRIVLDEPEPKDEPEHMGSTPNPNIQRSTKPANSSPRAVDSGVVPNANRSTAAAPSENSNSTSTTERAGTANKILWTTGGLLAVALIYVFFPKILVQSGAANSASSATFGTDEPLPTLSASLATPENSRPLNESGDPTSIPHDSQQTAKTSQQVNASSIDTAVPLGSSVSEIPEIPATTSAPRNALADGNNPDSLEIQNPSVAIDSARSKLDTDQQESSGSSLLDKFKATSGETAPTQSKKSTREPAPASSNQKGCSPQGLDKIGSCRYGQEFSGRHRLTSYDNSRCFEYRPG